MQIKSQMSRSVAFVAISMLLGGGIFVGLGQAEDNALTTSLTIVQPGTDESTQTSIHDVSPPTPPANLQTLLKSDHTGIKLYWNLSLDNVGVSGYAVFRNGSKIASIDDTYYTDTSAARGVGYQYIVRARDAAGNWSGASNIATAMIPAEVAVVAEQPVTTVTNQGASITETTEESNESDSTSSTAESSESSSSSSSGSLGTLDLNSMKTKSVKRPITLINPPISKKEAQPPVK